ncbi:hypothetical protein K439DRAFT_1619002 [Ramaria rubella]|nr:hypothetical protein K439DRAFT_1619002 [Ramaria rubella]
MLVAMDGNESLKCVERAHYQKDNTGTLISSEKIEWEDSHTIVSDMHLSEDAINQFRKCKQCNLPLRESADDPAPVHAKQSSQTPVYSALVMCDMVQSGELAKYPLAVSNELLDTFGAGLLLGYEPTTAQCLGPKYASIVASIVWALHGHAHCRTCQLNWHPLYLKGCGLEDFETCEHVFSQSNVLASTTWLKNRGEIEEKPVKCKILV